MKEHLEIADAIKLTDENHIVVKENNARTFPVTGQVEIYGYNGIWYGRSPSDKKRHSFSIITDEKIEEGLYNVTGELTEHVYQNQDSPTKDLIRDMYLRIHTAQKICAL